MRTADIKTLIENVLARLPKPVTEDVIDDVFQAIELNPEWLQEYDDLCIHFGKTVVNTWGGFWIASHEGRSGHQTVSSKKSTLIGSYSKLTSAKTKPNGKCKEPEALKLMHAYYQEHQAELPAWIRKERALLIELLMDGQSAKEAFSMVVENRVKP